jgi:hypothetical protein
VNNFVLQRSRGSRTKGCLRVRSVTLFDGAPRKGAAGAESDDAVCAHSYERIGKRVAKNAWCSSR